MVCPGGLKKKLFFIKIAAFLFPKEVNGVRNLIKNPSANQGLQSWKSRGEVSIGKDDEGNPYFVVRYSGIRLFLQQADGRYAQNGSAASFDEPNIYLFDTEEEAKRLAIARARWEGTHDFWEDVGEFEITAPSAKPWPEESS